MRRWWPMSLESQMDTLLLKPLPPTHITCCVGRRGCSIGICLLPKFIPIVLCTAAALSGQKLALSHWWWSMLVALVGSLGKTSLAVEASWHLGLAICLPALKVSDGLLALTFLHVLSCITGGKGCRGGTLELCVPSVCCGQGSLLHTQRSSSLLGFCFVMLFGKRGPGLWHLLSKR